MISGRGDAEPTLLVAVGQKEDAWIEPMAEWEQAESVMRQRSWIVRMMVEEHLMTRDQQVMPTKRTARAVGALYIAATAAGVASIAPILSLIDADDRLATFAASKGQLILAVSLEFMMATSVAAVAFMIYPILKSDASTQTRQGMAVWYLGSRITEGALFLVAILARLSLFTLSQEFVKAGSPEGSHFQIAGEVLVTTSDHAYMLGQSVFCIGAMMLYYLLYQSKRVPRWLSVWGLIAAPLMLAAGLLVLIDGDPSSPLSTALYAPLALQEMVFAIWLIARGFNSAMSSGVEASIPPVRPRPVAV